MDYKSTSNENLLNQSFISMMPLPVSASRWIVLIKSSEYLFMTGSKAFIDAPLKVGPIVRRRNEWRILSLAISALLEDQIRGIEKIRGKTRRTHDIIVEVAFPCFTLCRMNILNGFDRIKAEVVGLNSDDIALKSTPHVRNEPSSR